MNVDVIEHLFDAYLKGKITITYNALYKNVKKIDLCFSIGHKVTISA